MSQVDLRPAEFRPVLNRPLATPRTLWLCVFVFAAFAALGAYAGWQLHTFWGALCPVPPAIMLGVCLSGLFPRYFFGKRNIQ